ncbi:MAG: dipeptidase [Lachnospiraceae bacterium]
MMRVVDMHCDTIARLLADKRAGKESSLYQNDGHVDLTKMKQSGYMLQNFALFVKLADAKDPWEEVQKLRDVYEEELAKNREILAPVYTHEDIEKNAKNGKMSAMLTVEEGGVCKGDIEKLEELYRQGVRMMTLSWNYPNGLCHPNLDADSGSRIHGKMKGLEPKAADELLQEYLNTPDTENGLTDKGMEFVERMQEMGMIVDVSHMSDAGFFDVVRLAKKPFVASHSNARAVCPCVRNLTDEMIRALALKGGVSGLNFCADFLTPCQAGVPNPGTIEAIVRHAAHMVRIGGEECVGLGSDFDGIDTHAELPGAHTMSRLWEALKKGGFTERQLDKIFTDNVLRVYRETL